ncbi:adhesin for cattle intestine colonization [Escherichia coli]|nr:adhesin for cattle intestine colonization [Escherichia coli]
MNVPATDLSGLTASSYTVTATVSDKAGNPASADHALAVDVTAPDLTINTIAGDDIINAIEHGQALVVSGTSTGAAAGDVVTVNLNGKNYTTTLDASGNWSVGHSGGGCDGTGNRKPDHYRQPERSRGQQRQRYP